MPDRMSKAASIDCAQPLVVDMQNEETTPCINMETSLAGGQVERSPLLFLQKELRLKIWRYVLTDPSIDGQVLRICRKNPGPSSSSKRFSNSLCKSTETSEPQIETVFEAPRAAPINVSLLRTNWFIYQEALPVLYHSVKFCPWTLGSTLPLFLEKLSPLARAHIRYIILYIQDENLSDLFAWAITCAQVAKLDGSLRSVEVGGDWPLPGNERKQRKLLYPLLRIKAQKNFIGAHDAEFQEKLAGAAKELQAKAFMRRAFTAAESRANCGEPPNKKQRAQEVVFRARPAPSDPPPRTGDAEINQSWSPLSDVRIFDKDLEQWDIVSVESASSNRKWARTRSLSDNGIWDYEAPSIIKEDEDVEEEGGDDWEMVEYSCVLECDSRSSTHP